MQKIKKQYGIWTGIAMVIGIVIGSGVFIKAGGVLTSSGGDLKVSLLAWLVGGIIMVASGFCFAVFATKVTKFSGVVDYVEAATNKKVGYFIAWTMTTLYYPIITAVVACFAGHYFFRMFGLDYFYGDLKVLLFAFVFITLSVILNYFSPKLSAKFQVSSTVIKLIPIAIIAVVGLFASLIIGPEFGIANAIKNSAETGATNFGAAVTTTASAYEGWVCATSINAELKDSKKNLPRALLWGSIIIIAIYILYFIGVAGAASTTDLASSGVTLAVNNIFGNVGGTILTVFVMVSCLGTLNGLTMGSTRAMYGIATRDCGPKPDTFKNIDSKTDMPANSCFVGLLCCSLWLLYFFGANLTTPWFGLFSFDSSELPIITIYAFYIPIFINWMRKE
jgi:APA family basic amino acid/polyamine antiporter